jgi:site-specific recombinase XerD
MVDVSRIRMSGPLRPFAAWFGEELARRGYAYFSARQQLWLVAHLSRWMEERDLALTALTNEAVQDFVAARRAAGFTAFRTPKALEPFMRYMRGVGAIAAPAAIAPTSSSDPAEALLSRYREYMLRERGVSAKTARDYTDCVRPFLASRMAAGGVESSTAADVTGFILGECRRRRVRAAQMVVTATRSLLRFLQVEGLVGGSLISAVPKVPDRREAMAHGLAPEQVQTLLRSCDRSAFGRRDLAIMLMLARLGLRAGEVAGLLLDDIDWRRGEILIHGKPNRCDRLPLPIDVGEALVEYLRAVRPADALDRHVFIRVLAPHHAMSPVGITQVVVAAGERTGLGWVTAHRLRHSAATAMLRAGASLPEIGQVLRHQRPATTALYAKVDIDALRLVARPWPGGAR